MTTMPQLQSHVSTNLEWEKKWCRGGEDASTVYTTLPLFIECAQKYKIVKKKISTLGWGQKFLIFKDEMTFCMHWFKLGPWGPIKVPCKPNQCENLWS